MKSAANQRIGAQINSYAQFMSFEAAVAKVKRNSLGRIDYLIDSIAKQMEAAK